MEVNLARVIKDIETLATFTATPGNGVTRSSYSHEDKLAKEYLKNEMERIGLKVWEDGFSTLFGRREGKNPDAPVIMIGSHYDSVVNGGAFDGVAGTVAALEILRVFHENNIENEYPIEIIAMNAEEGETFGSGTGVSNSRALVGTLTEKELDTVKNRHGLTKREAMKEYGLIPDLEAAKREKGSIKNFIELHIEQGPVLDNHNIDIGLVEYLPGIGRYKVNFYGKLADSTAPMDTRQDAMVAASRFVLAVNQIVKSLGPGITGTVGELEVSPNSHQFVPEYVQAKVEIRTFDVETLKNVNLHDLLMKEINSIEAETNVEIELTEMARVGYSNPTPPSVMVKENVELMENICKDLGYKYTIINNGTGHDAMIMADFAPTNFIYVPSKEGISHDPDEWTDYEDIKKGIHVMMQLVYKLCK
ncbi:Zn-dependent hydrolase [Virgibacillus pantothenticus]|uniref:Amidase n=1 Tax=Virgibacillus pantothenticus TaxID=1473 RepID=A0A0L0QWN5_VIRPA|nr:MULTISPECIES: M20 family metallo-hydrolase [Virgibacillus]API92437.1 Zn-dependent hydrolase [Virgibacillus sp. 6R]KNE22613.1 amidase [Virgibacillus pantothenticus]MBS7427314.1 M20 family metallo-hydrolase [Virgibacillus sp. 19R1-5]MBU8567034.1 M20 family metallo-hydrolase [Virgibacillus pantothenticus]MBU8601958.1 M20 family metallo-hydrolase [Virgibacillus pantothenticus]